MMKIKRNTRELLLPLLFLIMSVLLVLGCDVTSQADIAAEDTETQPIQTTTTTPASIANQLPFQYQV